MSDMDPREEDRLRAKYQLLLHRLDQHQAGLVLGADANALTANGGDGITIIARAADLDPAIIAAGTAELNRLNSPSN